ncbi:MAG TPA: SPW repeat protein [Vicinamibacterales bacterium]|nr:SPW repeat protein [Vicinamibacterales bacterium]
MKAASWVTLLLGAWMAASPFVLHVDPTLSHANEIGGIVMVLLSGWALVVPPQKRLAGSLCLLLGFWIFTSPYALGVVETSVPLANNGIAGALLIIFAVLRITLAAPLPGERHQTA